MINTFTSYQLIARDIPKALGRVENQPMVDRETSSSQVEALHRFAEGEVRDPGVHPELDNRLRPQRVDDPPSERDVLVPSGLGADQARWSECGGRDELSKTSRLRTVYRHRAIVGVITPESVEVRTSGV